MTQCVVSAFQVDGGGGRGRGDGTAAEGDADPAHVRPYAALYLFGDDAEADADAEASPRSYGDAGNSGATSGASSRSSSDADADADADADGGVVDRAVERPVTPEEAVDDRRPLLGGAGVRVGGDVIFAHVSTAMVPNAIANDMRHNGLIAGGAMLLSALVMLSVLLVFVMTVRQRWRSSSTSNSSRLENR